MGDAEILHRAAQDMVLDRLFAPDIEQQTDAKLAALYDEFMALPTEAQVKEAADRAAAQDPVVKDAERLLEVQLLGKVGAHAYTETMAQELPKLAQGLEGLKTKLLGSTPEERMRRERAKREQELDLRPREVSLDLGTQGATGNLGTEQALQGLGLREATQRQELANQLRKLQLGDQYSRREREQQLYDLLHKEKQVAGPLPHMMAGGLLGHLAAGAGRAAKPGLAGILEAAGKGQAAGALRGLKLPGIRGGLAGGLGVYLARKALESTNPATRPVTRLERERFIPQSMTSDVQP